MKFTAVSSRSLGLKSLLKKSRWPLKRLVKSNGASKMNSGSLKTLTISGALLTELGGFESARLEVAAEEIALAAEAVGEIERRVEDELGKLEDVDDQRRVIDRDEAHRLGGRAVEVLVRGVERRREQAAGLPFDRDLPFLAPELCRAAPFEDQNLLFVQMAHRLEVFSRRDLARHRADEALRAFEMAIGRRAAHALPMRERQRAQVRDAEAADNFQPFVIAPLQERGFFTRALFPRVFDAFHGGSSFAPNP